MPLRSASTSGETAKTALPAAPHFAFGKNWQHFLHVVDKERIAQAEKSFVGMLGETPPRDARMLDIGCGSGLSSLIAQQRGFTVTAFDYDAKAVLCATEMRSRFGRTTGWSIEVGDVLDQQYMETLGSFDLVHAWGSLHHTGNLWTAVANAAARVGTGGVLWLAIYNDQGGTSRRWTRVKRLYQSLPPRLQPVLVAASVPVLWWKDIARDTLRGDPLASWRNRSRERGMSAWHDMVDWIGGYPFEVAKPEQVLEFLVPKGFVLERLKTCGGGLGCNEYLFRKSGSATRD